MTEFQYQLCLLTFDANLSFAPLQRLNRVLDVGCGLGKSPDTHAGQLQTTDMKYRFLGH